MVALLILARHIRLRLRRDEAGLLPEIGKILAVVVAVLRGAFRSRCAAAAGSGGTAPGPPRSGGNNARRAGSSSRRRPDRRKSGRRAPAARYFSATCEAVPRILMSGPLDSNTRVIGFWPRRLLLLLLLLLLLFRLRIRLLFSDRFSCLAFIPALKLPALRSTPRVKRLELGIENSLSRLLRTVRRASSAHALCSSISHGFCRTSQSTKTRSPAIRRSRAGCTKSFSLPKQAQIQLKSSTWKSLT